MESVFGFLFFNPCDQNSPGEAGLSLLVDHNVAESSVADMVCIKSWISAILTSKSPLNLS